jgi:hypothetical protein
MMQTFHDEAPTGEHDVIGRIGRADREKLRRRGVVGRLKFLLCACEASVEVSLDSVLVYSE